MFGKFIHKSSKAKDKNPAVNTENNKNLSSNGRVPCQEHYHNDDEVITPSGFPFREIFPAFQGEFDVNTMNIFTGRIMSNSHHMKNEGPKTRKHFRNFNACFCLEWIQVMIDGAIYWVRCGDIFNLYSAGCYNHPKSLYKDGPNRVYFLLGKGKCGNWGMIKNIHIQPEEEESTEERERAQAQKDLEGLGEHIAMASQQGRDVEQL
jgi:hypothetical protein